MTLTICVPYSMIEPIRSKLDSGFQADQNEIVVLDASYLLPGVYVLKLSAENQSTLYKFIRR